MKTVALLGNSDLVIYNFRKELVERLVSENIRVVVMIPKVVHKDFFENLNCEIYETEIDRRGTNPLKDLKLFFTYKKLLKKIRPDIIYTYTIKCSVYGGIAAHQLHIPQIANVTGLGSAVKAGGMLQYISEKMYKMGVKHAKCTFYQNVENQNLCLKKEIVGESYELLPGSGVNLEQFTYLPLPKDDVVHFLFISRIMKEKGIDQYLETAKYIRKKYPNTCFHVLGFCEEDYLNTLQNLENEGIIKYHGMQDDMVSFQKISHCTIHPSYYAEGMSNVCLESAACGRAVITTNNPGCFETVEDGKTGYIVPMKDSEALIRAVEKFLQLSYEEKEKMGRQGRKKMEQEFDRQIVVEAYLRKSKEWLS